MRLPTKPWQTPTRTGALPIVREIDIAVATASGADFSPRTTSTSFMMLAGLKKCMPRTSSGRAVSAPITLTSR